MKTAIDTIPNYTRAVEAWPEAATLRGYYDSIVNASDGECHGLVEHVKGFIECVCITILSEFNVSIPTSTPTSTELLVAALKPLGLQNSKGASKLDKILSGFNKLSDAISEMRNESGPVAHGKDGFYDSLRRDHGRAFLYTGDAIVGVLLNALEGTDPDLMVTREPYERFAHLGEKIDRSVSMKASVEVDETGHMLIVAVTVAGKNEETTTLRLVPSQLLYGMDRAAFVDILNEASSAVFEPEEAPVEEVQEAPVEEIQKAPVEEAPVDGRVAEMEIIGQLEEQGAALGIFLASEGLLRADSGDLINKLLITAQKNMVVDWQVRESQIAILRQGFRRDLLSVGLSRERASEGAEHLVTWFLIQIPHTN